MRAALGHAMRTPTGTPEAAGTLRQLKLSTGGPQGLLAGIVMDFQETSNVSIEESYPAGSYRTGLVAITPSEFKLQTCPTTKQQPATPPLFPRVIKAETATVPYNPYSKPS